jgi:osmotically-inducible protein OsmY
MITRDETLCRDIREALKRDQRVAHRSIDVNSTRGIVTLRGCAVTRSSILAAIQIVASFPACRGVVNRQVLAKMRLPQTPALWALPAGDGMLGRFGDAFLPNDALPASA